FTDGFFKSRLLQWLKTGRCSHRTDHVKPLAKVRVPGAVRKLGGTLAAKLQRDKAIMGIFDEGCMGMFNAIIPDDLLHATGVFKERLSQSALYYEASQVSDTKAREVYDWFKRHGMKFHTGPSDAADLTDGQILWQCKVYIAAVRIAD